MKVLSDFDKVKARVIPINLTFGKIDSLTENGICVTAFCLKHSPYWKDGVNRHENIRNIGYVVELEGTRFYHSGDATFKDNLEAFQQYDFINKPVDVLFVQRYDTSNETKELVAGSIKPDKIIAMHIKADELSHWRGRFTKHFPYGIVFDKQGESYKFILLK